MVRFLLDENVPSSVLKLLRRRVHEAHRPRELGLGRAKNSVLAEYAIRENRVIVTLDEDFLKLRKELLNKVKVVFVSLRPVNPELVAQVVEKNLDSALDQLSKRNVVTLTKEGAQ